MFKLSEKTISIAIRSVSAYFLLALLVPFLNPIDLKVSLISSYSTLQRVDVYGLILAIAPDIINTLYFFITVFVLCFISIITGTIMTFINDKLNRAGETVVFITTIVQDLALLIMNIIFAVKDFVIETNLSIGAFITFIMSTVLLILLLLKKKSVDAIEQSSNNFSHFDSRVCLDDNQNPYLAKGLNETIHIQQVTFQQSNYPNPSCYSAPQQFSPMQMPYADNQQIFQLDYQNPYGSYGQMSPTPGLNESHPPWNYSSNGDNANFTPPHTGIPEETMRATDFSSLISSHNSYFQDRLNNNFFQ